MAGKKGCLRRGCGCLGLLLVLGAAVALFAYLRSGGEPEVYREQRQLLEERSPEEREELAKKTLQRLRDVLRPVPPSRNAGSRPDTAAADLGSSSSPSQPGSLSPQASGQEESPDPSGDRRALRDGPGRRSRDASGDEEQEEKDGASRITLRLDELNALLEQEASRWMAEQGSDRLPLSNPTLAIEGDHLVLFVQLSTPASTFLLGLPFQATVDETGGTVNLLGVRLGQLPLPGLEALPRLLRAAKDPRLDQLAEKADLAAAGYPIEPRLELGDGRALWVLDAEIDPEQQAVHLLVEEL